MNFNPFKVYSDFLSEKKQVAEASDVKLSAGDVHSRHVETAKNVADHLHKAARAASAHAEVTNTMKAGGSGNAQKEHQHAAEIHKMAADAHSRAHAAQHSGNAESEHSKKAKWHEHIAQSHTHTANRQYQSAEDSRRSAAKHWTPTQSESTVSEAAGQSHNEYLVGQIAKHLHAAANAATSRADSSGSKQSHAYAASVHQIAGEAHKNANHGKLIDYHKHMENSHVAHSKGNHDEGDKHREKANDTISSSPTMRMSSKVNWKS
jgi:hypothetical protein